MISLAVGAVVALLQVDMVVHRTLYDYGLVFDYEWPMTYWMFERLAISLFIGVAGINAFSLVYTFFAEKDLMKAPKQLQLRPKPETMKREPKSVEPDKAFPKQEQRQPLMKTTADDDGVEVVALPMVCNKCSKVFTQPLCMFDFKSGKPRLVNVCPYCNAVLAVSGNAKEQ